jgi:hypothetical protein
MTKRADDLLLILFTGYLFIAPLHWTIPDWFSMSSTRMSWNGQVASLGLVLLLYYVFSLKGLPKHPDKKSVLLSIFLSIAIILKTFLLDRGDVSTAEVARLLGLIWFIPFVVTVVRLYGRSVVIVLVVAIAVLQAQWALAQFVLQHDLHLYLLGETQLSVSGPGIAKFLSTGHKIIRAYGPYAHPNMLGGVLAISLVLFTQVRWRSRVTALSLSSLLFVGILITFSRAAWLSAICCVALFYLFHKRGHSLRFIAIALLVFMPFVLDRSVDYQDVATSERVSGLQSGQQVWQEHPWAGTGIGNYKSVLTKYMEQRGLSYQPWEIAPIHVAPALLLAEWGVLGMGLLVLSLWMYSIYIQKPMVSSALINKSLWLVPTAPLLLLDHYLLTETGPMVWYLVLLVVLWLDSEWQSDSQ